MLNANMLDANVRAHAAATLETARFANSCKKRTSARRPAGAGH
jgi:hypothetical protein